MATLVLTAAGTAVGGPIGGAIGAIVGQSIDQRLFAPKARHGPRLGDLAVQTSSYGTQLPLIFGTMRAAGTVIWATDLIEQRSSTGGGKGRPKTVSYSYSANLAVALSARKLRSVGRIWADGKLLRGAAGDFKSDLAAFRFHDGDEDQPADPLIVSAEGAGAAPAYRGIAYVVFEGLQLDDFGNRIPFLTFEVEADAAPPAIGAIAEALSEGAVKAGQTVAVGGYAASGDSVRSAIEALADVVPLSLADQGGQLIIRVTDEEPLVLPRTSLCAPPLVVRRAAASVADEVSLAYYEPERDYQTGMQRAFTGGSIRRSDRRSLAAALDAATAKSLAELRLGVLRAARSTARITVGSGQIGTRPGQTIQIEGEPGRWLVRRLELGPMTLAFDLTRLPDAVAAVAGATPGRSVGGSDLMHGPTVLRLLDLPLPFEREGAWLFLLAAGSMAGWRRAAVAASFDGGATFTDLGATAAPATIGHAITAIPPAGSALLDTHSLLEVELLHDSMHLEGRSDAALAGGGNLASLGGELIQFGRVEPIGPRRFKLSRLLRGRRGTEGMAHVPGETFALIRPEDVLPIALPPGSTGGEVQVVAAGVGDGPAGVSTALIVTGETLRPPSPVHLHAVRPANGDVVVSWVRRSRAAWSWTSGADAPLGEERERYLVRVSSGALSRVVEIEAPSFTYTAADQASDGIAPPFTVEIRQIGTHAASRPAQIEIA